MVTAALNWQSLLDRYTLATYRPALEIAALAARDQLTDKGRAIFYAGRPTLDTKTAFNLHCQEPERQLLGCYNRGRISILKIDNPSLAEEVDVTAAHEMLHAAYRRLGSAERRSLDQQLTAAAAGAGPELAAELQAYGADERLDELHSRLGTEVARLSPALELYYHRYLADRRVIVAAHQKFTAVLDGAARELDRLNADLELLKAQITNLRSRLNFLKAAGDIAGYNRLVPRHNQLVDIYNAQATEYNQKLEEYRGLEAALDSRFQPQGSLEQQ
jgi:hypothetical protein